MSLSVNPVSMVSFRANSEPVSSKEDILNRPGVYTKPPVQPEVPKKHTARKVIIGTLAAAAVVAGTLYGLKRGFPEVFKAAENLADLKGLEKIKAYLTTGVAKGGEYVEKAGAWVVNSCTGAWGKLTGLFK